MSALNPRSTPYAPTSTAARNANCPRPSSMIARTVKSIASKATQRKVKTFQRRIDDDARMDSARQRTRLRASLTSRSIVRRARLPRLLPRVAVSGVCRSNDQAHKHPHTVTNIRAPPVCARIKSTKHHPACPSSSRRRRVPTRTRRRRITSDCFYPRRPRDAYGNSHASSSECRARRTIAKPRGIT